ncbi:PhoD-like phosphatase [Cadophora sp. DSE1049]|nr:PhoD-like phosphatase [Cadophora sp. DSE1049]
MIGPKPLLLHATGIVCLYSSIILKATVVYFVRLLPLGPRFIPLINTSLLIYLTAFLLMVITSSFNPRRRPASCSTRLRNIVLGAYTHNHARTNILSFLLTIIFYIASLDFVHRGNIIYQSPNLSFSRIGYVDESSAHITIRTPESANIQIIYRPWHAANETWEVGPVIQALAHSDHVGTFILTNLQANTTYTYHTNASHTGTFRTPPSHPKKWSMISSSCMSPFFPYNPFSHALHLPGLEHLSTYLSSSPSSPSSSSPKPKPQLMLFLGDFIYIDLPIRFGSTPSHYNTAYRKIYASPTWAHSPELKSLSWIHAYDDHEITNDWAGNGNAGEMALYASAMTPWNAYQAAGNPPPLQPNGTYYTFSRGDVSFFVLDTRRFRSPEHLSDGPEKTMLGHQQLNDVLTWLATEKKLKVLVSSVPFTRNWRGPESRDSWAGYLFERQKMLEAMWRTEGVVVVSGDRHEHATTHFPSPDGQSNVIEFSTSPLSQFYQPFERQYRQEEDSDIMVYSHPYGVSKFGVFDFDTTDATVWRVGFGLVVDGVRVWEYEWSAERRDR